MQHVAYFVVAVAIAAALLALVAQYFGLVDAYAPLDSAYALVYVVPRPVNGAVWIGVQPAYADVTVRYVAVNGTVFALGVDVPRNATVWLNRTDGKPLTARCWQSVEVVAQHGSGLAASRFVVQCPRVAPKFTTTQIVDVAKLIAFANAVLDWYGSMKTPKIAATVDPETWALVIKNVYDRPLLIKPDGDLLGYPYLLLAPGEEVRLGGVVLREGYGDDASFNMSSAVWAAYFYADVRLENGAIVGWVNGIPVNITPAPATVCVNATYYRKYAVDRAYVADVLKCNKYATIYGAVFRQVKYRAPAQCTAAGVAVPCAADGWWPVLALDVRNDGLYVGYSVYDPKRNLTYVEWAPAPWRGASTYRTGYRPGGDMRYIYGYSSFSRTWTLYVYPGDYAVGTWPAALFLNVAGFYNATFVIPLNSAENASGSVPVPGSCYGLDYKVEGGKVYLRSYGSGWQTPPASFSVWRNYGGSCQLDDKPLAVDAWLAYNYTALAGVAVVSPFRLLQIEMIQTPVGWVVQWPNRWSADADNVTSAVVPPGGYVFVPIPRDAPIQPPFERLPYLSPTPVFALLNSSAFPFVGFADPPDFYWLHLYVNGYSAQPADPVAVLPPDASRSCGNLTAADGRFSYECTYRRGGDVLRIAASGSYETRNSDCDEPWLKVYVRRATAVFEVYVNGRRAGVLEYEYGEQVEKTWNMAWVCQLKQSASLIRSDPPLKTGMVFYERNGTLYYYGPWAGALRNSGNATAHAAVTVGYAWTTRGAQVYRLTYQISVPCGNPAGGYAYALLELNYSGTWAPTSFGLAKANYTLADVSACGAGLPTPTEAGIIERGEYCYVRRIEEKSVEGGASRAEATPRGVAVTTSRTYKVTEVDCNGNVRTYYEQREVATIQTKYGVTSIYDHRKDAACHPRDAYPKEDPQYGVYIRCPK